MIKYAVFPFWFGFAPVFVAQERVIFKRKLEVTTAFDNDRANVLPAMATGQLVYMRILVNQCLGLEPDWYIIGTIDISVGADGLLPGEIKCLRFSWKNMAGEITRIPGPVCYQKLEKYRYLIFPIATDDSIAYGQCSVATWEPMLSTIVKNSSRPGTHVLLSSADYEGLITDVILVRTDDYNANPDKYAKFLRGIYRAIDMYNSDPDKFIAISAPFFDTPPAEMKEALEGVKHEET